MDILKQITKQALAIDATIILPEANLDDRVKLACKQLLKNKMCKIIVFGKVAEFDATFTKNPNCKIIDISEDEHKAELANKLYELRKDKGLTLLEAKKLIKDPIYYAVMLLKLGYADGMVAGACTSTANVLRPALQIVKCKKGKLFVTGSMLMIKKGKPVLLFGDVSLVENPTAERLAEIAVSNAEFMDSLGVNPNVAMLSYSTYGSASSELTQKVVDAVKQTKNSKYKIFGEIQADAALKETVAKQKGVKAIGAGHANVLIFPDLNSGNIGYKLTAHLGEYQAVGPIMLNFDKPVNDLSRGSNVQEIINTVMITKIQTKL